MLCIYAYPTIISLHLFYCSVIEGNNSNNYTKHPHSPKTHILPQSCLPAKCLSSVTEGNEVATILEILSQTLQNSHACSVKVVYLWYGFVSQHLVIKSKFMHNPISSISPRGSTSVKNQGFYHPHNCIIVFNWSILPSSLPIPSLGGPIQPPSGRILLSPRAKEVPTQIPILEQRHSCNTNNKTSLKNIKQ